MGMNGVTDLVASLTIPKPEYENLVMDSEKVKCIKHYIASSNYPSMDVVKAILNIVEEESEE